MIVSQCTQFVGDLIELVLIVCGARVFAPGELCQTIHPGRRAPAHDRSPCDAAHRLVAFVIFLLRIARRRFPGSVVVPHHVAELVRDGFRAHKVVVHIEAPADLGESRIVKGVKPGDSADSCLTIGVPEFRRGADDHRTAVPGVGIVHGAAGSDIDVEGDPVLGGPRPGRDDLIPGHAAGGRHDVVE